ncbi:hypothetical protein BCV69DRAFT_172870 [Microstroma glucosiphilum]|uniref:cAMP-independent regulatory protein pac2 n=1 Tax=Pseudomicrostroma glucosiphilum TaxID=1684307 RepID=A0A316UAT0_9BASI|nr:hypothetical protein BCV69DRAFT_172870 [Pseudomicrostroma glucosiphilum]PWN21523.1 hypothetical protein BCV69DRAFT_172870 [Pseudomicrostroma glucosiphilum]
MLPYQHTVGQQPAHVGGRTIDGPHLSAGHMISYPSHVQSQYQPHAHRGLSVYGVHPSPIHQIDDKTRRTVAYPYLPEAKHSASSPLRSPTSRTHPHSLSQVGHLHQRSTSDAAFSGASPASLSRRDWNASHPASAKQLSSPTATSLSSPSLTYTGHIKTSADAILLLAACDLPPNASVSGASGPSPTGFASTSASPPPRRIQRRLLEAERVDLVKSGSVFAWDEDEAGMRRWTDGRCWSASRVSGCFLTYRELEARKRSPNDPTGPRTNQYKVDGLIKQSFSMITTSGRKVHIVSYYTKKDLREGRLGRVSEDPRFVGEAGGEWGLHIDEEEYPDPVAALDTPSGGHDGQSVGNEEDSPDSPATANESAHPSSTPAASRSTQATGTSVGQYQISSVFASTSPSLAVAQSASLKRPMEGADGLNQSSMSANRPPLKRLRSSSTGELKRLRLGGGASGSGTLLTESNMRDAGFETAHDQQQRQHEQQHYVRRTQLGGDSTPQQIPSAMQAERDGSAAAGALLSLRLNGPSTVARDSALPRPSFLDTLMGGQLSTSSLSASTPMSTGTHPRLSSTRSYVDSGNESGSGGTPLTTPEERSPTSKGPVKETASSSDVRRRSDGAMPIGIRSDSDKDALSRFGVRL